MAQNWRPKIKNMLLCSKEPKTGLFSTYITILNNRERPDCFEP
jgi:hypothetical protein